MIGRPLKIILTLLSLMIAGYFIWRSLSVKFQHYNDIKRGNEIISNLQAYKVRHGDLPESDDWSELERLGFKINDAGVIPDYEKSSDSTFTLIYLEGFDGPYLTYDSKEADWKIK